MNHTLRTFVINPLVHICQKEKIPSVAAKMVSVHRFKAKLSNATGVVHTTNGRFRPARITGSILGKLTPEDVLETALTW